MTCALVFVAILLVVRVTTGTQIRDLRDKIALGIWILGIVLTTPFVLYRDCIPQFVAVLITFGANISSIEQIPWNRALHFLFGAFVTILLLILTLLPFPPTASQGQEPYEICDRDFFGYNVVQLAEVVNQAYFENACGTEEYKKVLGPQFDCIQVASPIKTPKACPITSHVFFNQVCWKRLPYGTCQSD